jgi:hypothetical protein
MVQDRSTSPSAKRPMTAAWPNAQSTRSTPMILARATALAILERTRLAPVSPASTSHVAAPAPNARNSASAPVTALGLRLSGSRSRDSKWVSSRRGLPGVVRRCRATSTGPSSPTCTTITSSPWARTHTSAPPRRCGAEYEPPSNATMAVVDPTVRVTPNATVYGVGGSGCRRDASSASISAGARLVTRCGRALMCSQNASQASSRPAKLS